MLWAEEYVSTSFRFGRDDNVVERPCCDDEHWWCSGQLQIPFGNDNKKGKSKGKADPFASLRDDKGERVSSLLAAAVGLGDAFGTA